MPVLLTSNFDDDSIKNERASVEIPFSHYKSIGNFLDAQGQLTPKSVVRRSGRNSNSSEILCMSSLPASIKGSDQKQPRKGGDTRVLIQSASKHYAVFLHTQ